MLLAVILATLLVVFVTAYALFPRKSHRRVYFVGPHCSGKTESIARLLGLGNPTVSSLTSNSFVVGRTEIVECLQDNLSQDFVNKFHINPIDKFVFFVKNEEEMGFFPDLTGFDICFVMWRKCPNKISTQLVYLDEDHSKLAALIRAK
ncbi:hypothetical protein PAPHI01_1724 [Pancytospora philotis]|nr:hypothetical protein PAPHI01_1724 [Pancytospora philotis]